MNDPSKNKLPSISTIVLGILSLVVVGIVVYIITNNKSKPNGTSSSSQPSIIQSKTFSESSRITDPKTLSSSSLSSSSNQTIDVPDQKPTGQKFTGWLGSNNIEIYLNYDKEKVSGKYYSSYAKKWYNLVGKYSENNIMGGKNGPIGTIDLDVFDSNVNVGKISFTTQNPLRFTNQKQQSDTNEPGYNSRFGIPVGQYNSNTIRTMGGFYTEKNSSTNSYDIFVSAELADIADFSDKVIEAKVAKLDDGNPLNSTIFEQNGNYYFTYEDWKTKDLKVGDKVKITGKIRSFNTAQVIELKPYIDQGNPGIFESTSAGIFQISDIKKI